MQELSLDQQLEQINVTEAQAKEMIDIRESLQRLNNNPDFKKIILEQYFKKEPERICILTGRLAHDEKAIVRLHNDLKAIGALQQFFTTIHQGANAALKTLEDTEQERLRIEQEAQEQ
jgi:hypothetical protein